MPCFSSLYPMQYDRKQRVYGPHRFLAEFYSEKNFQDFEVFINNIPNTILDCDLLAVLNGFGVVFKLRCLTNKYGLHLNYAFVMYTSLEDADNSIRGLNNLEIVHNWILTARRSINNRRLYITGLPKEVDAACIQNEFERYTRGIISVYAQPDKNAGNRGYAFIEFETHGAAATARKFFRQNYFVWNTIIQADWADPIPVMGHELLQKTKKLFVGNIPEYLTNNDMWIVFGKYVDVATVNKIYKTKRFGFIHFITHEFAAVGLEKLKGVKIDEDFISVAWGRPRMYSKEYRIAAIPSHYCLSVPPATRKMIAEKENTNGC